MWPDWAIYWTLVNFSKPVATISLPKSPTFVDNFCKGAKIYHFWATFIDIWRLFTGHTDAIPCNLFNSMTTLNRTGQCNCTLRDDKQYCIKVDKLVWKVQLLHFLMPNNVGNECNIRDPFHKTYFVIYSKMAVNYGILKSSAYLRSKFSCNYKSVIYGSVKFWGIGPRLGDFFELCVNAMVINARIVIYCCGW